MPDIPLPKPQKPTGNSVPPQNSGSAPVLPPSPTTPPPSAMVAPKPSMPTTPSMPTAPTVLTSTPPLGSSASNSVTGPASPGTASTPTIQTGAPSSIPSAAIPSAPASSTTPTTPITTAAAPTALPKPPQFPPQPGYPKPGQPLNQPLPQTTQPGQPVQSTQPIQAKQNVVSKQAAAPVKASASPLSRLTSSPFKFLPIIGVVLLVIVGGFFAFTQFFGGGSSQSVSQNVNTGGTGTSTGTQGTGTTPPATSGQPITLTYWGLWEQSETLQSVFDEFEEQNPGIKVQYVPQTHVDYRERLQTAIASGSGPDIYRFHASWVSMLAQELAPMPNSVMSVSEYQNTFFPVAAKQLQLNGQLVGIPLMYDGLGLYINTEMFRQAALSEPTTWAELKAAASRLTIRGSNGEIERAGLAIGNASNVEHFSDIIALLMLQNGATLANPSTKEAADALTFYTNFYKTDKVWSDKLPTSTVAFARGEVAMMFAPSWRVHEIRSLNPNLTDFKVIPTPSLGGQEITWATYWAEGVNSKSSSQKRDASWKLLKYMSSASVMKQLYSEQSKNRLFGQLYSRKDLAQEMVASSDPIVQNYVAPFLEGADSAQGGYLSSYTHDQGINDQLIKYYADAVNSILAGSSADTVMTTVTQGTQQVYRQYGASTTAQ